MKQEMKPLPLIHPTTICIVGTMYNELPNYTTIGDIAVAGLNPPLIMISLHKNHCAMSYINQHHKMSVNIPTEDMIQKVDYAGVYSAKNKDKSDMFEYQLVDGLPLITNCPINLIMEEVSRIEIEHRVILVCRIMRTFIDDRYLANNPLSLSDLKTVLYGLDNQYYTTGPIIGKGYHEYKANE